MILLGWACSVSPPPQVSAEPATVDTAPPDSDLDGFLVPAPPLPELQRHGCAVVGDGAVWCWGANRTGQLGRGAKDRQEGQTHAPGPALVPSRVVGVAAGIAHTCALDEAGAVSCWGRNHEHQVSPPRDPTRRDLHTVIQPLPVRRDLPERVLRIGAGGDSSCAVGISGRAWCWGSSAPGLLEVGQDVVDLWVGYGRRCVLHRDGAIDCAGRGLPPQTRAPGAVRVVVQQDEVCTLDGAGAVRCGQIGVPLPGPARELVAGARHLCALVEDAAWCWGGNGSGQVRAGAGAEVDEPVRVQDGVHAISTGRDATCAGRADGVSCWGSEWSGQLEAGAVPGPVGSLSLGG